MRWRRECGASSLVSSSVPRPRTSVSQTTALPPEACGRSTALKLRLARSRAFVHTSKRDRRGPLMISSDGMTRLEFAPLRLPRRNVRHPIPSHQIPSIAALMSGRVERWQSINRSVARSGSTTFLRTLTGAAQRSTFLRPLRLRLRFRLQLEKVKPAASTRATTTTEEVASFSDRMGIV